MKTELKVKFLQHLSQKKQDEGFTLIELLVVIIIIGILSAIALPSFLNQANKAKQSEAKTYVGSMNRSQQAYYLEKGEFAGKTAAEFAKLGLGISTATTNYSYVINGGGLNSTSATIQAQPAKGANATVRAYQGGVNAGTVAATSEATTLAVLCQGTSAPVAGGPDGKTDSITFSKTAAPVCTGKYEPVSK